MKNCLLYILLLSVFVSCGDKRKLIPENELGDIIVKSVVAESFLKNTGRLNRGINDSLNFYLPILDDYNYSVEDVEYTIERMVQRKSNLFGSLMEKISKDISVLKDHYEAQSNMGRNWRKKVKNDIFDTLYFSPDTIHIKKYKDLKNIDYRFPINGDGNLIVKYNYVISNADSNYSRYFTYTFSDSVSKKNYSHNNYWLNKAKTKATFEKEIPITNSNKNNYFTMRVLSYSSKDEMPHKNGVKNVDFYIDSVTVIFKPDYKIGDKRLLKKLGNYQLFTNINYLTEDSVTNRMPYAKEFGRGVAINPDSVRYHRILPIGKDPVEVEKIRKKKEAADKIKRKKELEERKKKADERRKKLEAKKLVEKKLEARKLADKKLGARKLADKKLEATKGEKKLEVGKLDDKRQIVVKPDDKRPIAEESAASKIADEKLKNEKKTIK